MNDDRNRLESKHQDDPALAKPLDSTESSPSIPGPSITKDAANTASIPKKADGGRRGVSRRIKEIRRAEWFVIAPTIVIAATGIAGLYIFDRQLDAMREQSRESRRALVATQRAYVHVQDVTLRSFEVGKRPEAIIHYKNAGLTPAKDLEVGSVSFFHPLRITSRAPDTDVGLGDCTDLPYNSEGFGRVLPAGAVDTANTLAQWIFKLDEEDAFSPLSKKDFDAIRHDEKLWYVIVYIAYYDQFGGCHRSIEPFMYRPGGRTFDPANHGWKETEKQFEVLK